MTRPRCSSIHPLNQLTWIRVLTSRRRKTREKINNPLNRSKHSQYSRPIHLLLVLQVILRFLKFNFHSILMTHPLDLIADKSNEIIRELDNSCKIASSLSLSGSSVSGFRHPATRNELTSYYLHFVGPKPFYKTYSYL